MRHGDDHRLRQRCVRGRERESDACATVINAEARLNLLYTRGTTVTAYMALLSLRFFSR